MAKYEHAETFKSAKFESDAADMRARKERVSSRGEAVYAKTGRMDPLVSCHKSNRVSHNSLIPGPDGTFYILPNGIALPIISGHDGTGSMAENLGHCFDAMLALDSLLNQIRSRWGYNTQIASAIGQDVRDAHDVAQMSQFESDNRIADQIRLLIPDGDGGDATEDYQVLLNYIDKATTTDIFDMYGLKGYFFFMADQICRESTSKSEIKEHLEMDLGAQSSTTKELCQAILRRYHMFYLQVGASRRDSVTAWWDQRLGKGRTILVIDPTLLAETQVALIYATESETPTREEAVNLLMEGTKANAKLTARKANMIWDWIEEAGVSFGAQFKLKKGKHLPQPGDHFSHFRHTWPIGHPNAGENVTPVDGEASPRLLPSRTKSGGKLDWGKF